MPNFSYEALNDANEVISGQVAAENVAKAIHQVESQGMRITLIQLIETALPAVQDVTVSSTTIPKTPGADFDLVVQRIRVVLEKRHVLIPALSAFAEEFPRGRSRFRLRQLIARLRTGATAAEICQSPEQTAFLVSLGSGGTGSHRMLSSLFIEAAHEDESRAQWVRTLLYPLLVFLISLGVLLFLCVAVVPHFSLIYRDFGMALPTMTQYLLVATGWFVPRPFVVVLIIFIAGAVVYSLLRFVGEWGLPGRLVNALSQGNSRQLVAMARFTRRLAEALNGNITLPAALRIAGRAEGRGIKRRVALQLADDSEQAGFELKKSPYARRLPATVVHALQAGPDGRPSIALLQQLADIYAERVRYRGDMSTGFLGQFAIIAVGLAVGVVVLALFLPLIDLINNLSG